MRHIHVVDNEQGEECLSVVIKLRLWGYHPENTRGGLAIEERSIFKLDEG
ncbi:MAG: hypothetical protein GF368_05040 [Candidatus Aenigmarchaeota archaeon]|nr:hypothetical protein [Candidatus Aenigmarchaeota archaeon]